MRSLGVLLFLVSLVGCSSPTFLHSGNRPWIALSQGSLEWASVGEDEYGFARALKEAFANNAYLVIAARPALASNREWKLISFGEGVEVRRPGLEPWARIQTGDYAITITDHWTSLSRCAPLREVLEAAMDIRPPPVEFLSVRRMPLSAVSDGITYQIWTTGYRFEGDPFGTDRLTYFADNVDSELEALMRKAEVDLDPCW